MTKLEFISILTGKLSHLPWEAVRERVEFYIEAIEDRVEEGLSEEEAVAEVGSPDEIAAQIIADLPPAPVEAPSRKQRRKLSSGEILLLVLGSPLWLSLLIAAAAVVISLYASLWAVVISLWAAFVSVVAGAFAGVVGGAFLTFANASSSIFMIGAGIFCIGAAILLLHGCKAATKGAIRLGAYPVSLLVKKWRER